MALVTQLASLTVDTDIFDADLDGNEVEKGYIHPTLLATKQPFLYLLSLFPVFIVAYEYTRLSMAVGSVLLILGLFLLIRRRLQQTAFLITNKRILKFKNTQLTSEAYANTVEDITVSQSIFGSLLDYGTITVVTADSAFELAGVLDPYRVKTQLSPFLESPHEDEETLDDVVDSSRIENADADLFS